MKLKNQFRIFLAVMMMAMFAAPSTAWAQSYQLGGNYVKFQKFVQPNPEEAGQYVETTEAEAGETVTASIDDTKIPQGKYFTGDYSSQDVTLTTYWSGATFTMPAKNVTVNAKLADQEEYTIDLTTSTTAVIPMKISTLLSYMEVGGKTCSVYDKDNNWFLDLNVDGINDLEVKSSFDQTTQDYVYSLVVLSGNGVYKTSCSFALNIAPPDQYKSLIFKFKEAVPVRILQANWITLSDGPFAYDGMEKKPQVTVTDNGTDVTSYFDVTYQNNVLAGESTDAKAPTVTVSAKSGQTMYQGSAQQTFTITPRVTTEGSRIAVIADPHVMPASLLTNPSNTDWTTYLAGSRKLIDYSQTLLDQTVATLKSDKPELVLIVGDLTKDGEQASHNYLKGKLDELKAAGILTLVIPGNHDLGSSDAKIYGATTTDAPTISQSDFAQLYQDYGYGSTSERESATSLTYVCEPIDGLVVIGIDSGEEGQLSEATLTWVCDKAIAARGAGKQVIAMMHHPLIPHITGGEAFVSTVSVADYATVRNRLADAGISVIFTGHFHTSDIAKDWNGDKKLSIYDVTTGSLCSYPCDYRIVTFNDALTQMQIDTQSITSAGAPLGGGDQFTTSIAKTRLSKSMENILKPRLTAKLVASGTSQNLAAIAVNAIAPSLAQAYIYHAEGDEHKNSAAQSLLSNLNQLLEKYPAYKTMASSMLEDKSNYGTDRVDQTNDRSLSVSIERAAKSIQFLEVTIAQGPFIYTGQEIKPAVTVKDGEKDVTACFDVTYTNNIDANDGTGTDAPTITVSAKTDYPQYSGKVTMTFAIMTTAKIEIKKTEQLKKGDTFDAAIGQTEAAPQEVSTNYTLCILDGVWVNATVTAELESLTEGKATYTVTGNKASKLTLGSVTWKDNGALMDHSQTLNNIDFSGADVETSNINFKNIESLDAGKKMTLVAGFGDKAGTITGSKYIIGTTLEGVGKASLDDNNLIFTIETVTAQAQTHNTVMGAAVSYAVMTFNDCHMGAALDGLSLTSKNGADGVATFAQMGGGSMRQETGARVMVRGAKVVRPYFSLSYSGARIMCKAEDVALQAAEETQGKVRGVAEPDITIESGKTYEILTDGDLTLTLKLSEGDILITAITLKYPDPNDLNLDGEVNAADIVKAIADGKSQAEIDAIVDQIMEQ